jgi:hypothetical protein
MRINSLFHKKTNPKDANRSKRGQSFVELALILPLLLLMLLGMVEVVFFIGRYLDILDLTREAARFASVRDPFDFNVPRDKDCRTPGLFDYFYDTSCVFSPPAGSPSCSDLRFCNGLNSFVVFDPATDDIVISIYTVSGGNVTDVWPQAGKAPPPGELATTTGYWAFSDQDADTTHNSNWKKDCNGNIVRTEPYYNLARVQASMVAGAPPTKGFVAVEFYYCYHQVLGAPIISQLIPNPMRIHAYTLMPLPAAAPTPTPTTNP